MNRQKSKFSQKNINNFTNQINQSHQNNQKPKTSMSKRKSKSILEPQKCNIHMQVQ